MKTLPLLFLFVVTLVSCSVPKKYAYNFDHHKYQPAPDPAESKIPVQDLQIDPNDLTADASSVQPIRIEERTPVRARPTRQDLKKIVKEIRTELKTGKAPGSVHAEPAWKNARPIEWVSIIFSLTGAILSIVGLWQIGLPLVLIGLLLLFLFRDKEANNT